MITSPRGRGRPKSLSPREIVWPIRLSKKEATLVDCKVKSESAARGEWIRNTLLEAAVKFTALTDIGKWGIGTYCGADSVCVNYERADGKRFHRHDYGGILPRFIRLGMAIRSIEKEEAGER